MLHHLFVIINFSLTETIVTEDQDEDLQPFNFSFLLTPSSKSLLNLENQKIFIN